MLALVPFTTGCRIDGLWGFDDDSDAVAAVATPVAATTIVLDAKVDLATDSVDTAGSGIPTTKIFEKDIFIVIGGEKLGPFGQTGTTITKTLSGSKWVYRFIRSVLKSALTIDTTGSSVLQVWAGTTQIATGSIPVGTNITNGANPTNTYVITLTQSATGLWTVTVVYTAPGATTGTAVTQPTQATTLGVESIGYSTDGTTYYSLNNATEAAFADPKIKVTFSTTVSKATDTFSVSFKNNTTNQTETLTQADIASGKLTVTAGEVTEGGVKKTTLVFALAGTNAGRMDPNTKYTVTYTSSSVVRSDSATTTLTAPAAFDFTTKKAALVSWDAMNAANATVKTGTTAYEVASTATQVKLTFDYAMTAPTTTELAAAKFDKTVGASALTALAYDTYFQAPVLDTTKKMMTIALKKNLTVGSYSVKYNAGTFKDANGAAIDTTTTVTFTVK
jgi:hypothetical protein